MTTGIATVPDVLRALDAAIEEALERGDRIGYFAAMYRQVTARVWEGIETGFFDDAERMARLDVTFASRYLDALGQYRGGHRPTWSWELAFQAARDIRPLIVQHLLVGMNAHINLDLGIAAAATAPGDALPGLRRDFDRINEVLGLLVGRFEAIVGDASPWIGLLERIGGRHDEEIVHFSIEMARTAAWRFAVELAPLAQHDWAGPIASRDAQVARIGRGVLHPGLPLELGLAVIRSRESNDVRRVIRQLAGAPAPPLEQVERRVRMARHQPLHDRP
ncbi:MAG TPA: DUF5995 family protein [Acidimicrobiales bacterium]|nr:DUF5995 family protein [Acidimicrobiales bacterium]